MRKVYAIYVLALVCCLMSCLFSCKKEDTPPISDPHAGTSIFAETAEENGQTEPSVDSQTEASDPLPTETLEEINTTAEIEWVTYPAGSTEIYNDNCIYMGGTSEDIAERNFNEQISFELLSADASIIQRATGVTKENVSSLKIFHDGGMKEMFYRETSQFNVSFESSRKFSSYDTYADENFLYNYEIYEDGTLRSYFLRDVVYCEDENRITREEAIDIARAYVEQWYAGHVDLSQYEVKIQIVDTDDRPFFISFRQTLHGLPTDDYCFIEMAGDGTVTEFEADHLGSCNIFHYITEEQITAAKKRLYEALGGLIRTAREKTLRLSMGDDGNLYLSVDASGWTFNEEGNIDENSYMVAEEYYVRVNP